MSYLTVTLTARGREPHNLELLPCTITSSSLFAHAILGSPEILRGYSSFARLFCDVIGPTSYWTRNISMTVFRDSYNMSCYIRSRLIEITLCICSLSDETDTPVLYFWVSKPECAAIFVLGGGVRVTCSLKFTSGATPANLLVASMASKPFSSTITSNRRKNLYS